MTQDPKAALLSELSVENEGELPQSRDSDAKKDLLGELRQERSPGTPSAGETTRASLASYAHSLLGGVADTFLSPMELQGSFLGRAAEAAGVPDTYNVYKRQKAQAEEAREGLQEWLGSIAAEDRKKVERFFELQDGRMAKAALTVPQGAGSMTAMMGPGAVLKSTKLAGLSGAALESAAMYYDAASMTEDEEIRALAYIAGLGIGATEMVGAPGFLARLNKASDGNLIRSVVVDSLRTGSGEAGQEYLQTVLENATAKGLYDPERGITEGATDAALAGFILGGMAGGAGSGVRGVTDTVQAERAQETGTPLAPDTPSAEVRAEATATTLETGQDVGVPPPQDVGKAVGQEPGGAPARELVDEGAGRQLSAGSWVRLGDEVGRVLELSEDQALIEMERDGELVQEQVAAESLAPLRQEEPEPVVEQEVHSTSVAEPLPDLDELDAAKLDELRSAGAAISPDARVRVYHRTTQGKANAIRASGRMSGEEDGLFFSTAESGQAEAYGDAVVAFDIPVQEMDLDDDFGNEMHVRVPLRRAGESRDVSAWLRLPDISPEAIAAVEPTPAQEAKAAKILEGPRKAAADLKEGIGKTMRALEKKESAKEEEPQPEVDGHSIKNARMDAALEAIGADPVKPGAKKTFREVNEKVIAQRDKDPKSGERLLEELSDEMRPLSAEEDVLLTHEVAELEADMFNREQEVIEAASKGLPTQTLERAAKRATTKYLEAADVVKRAGTATAQGLAFRQLMVKDDFSLANMIRERQVANRGKALPAEVVEELKDLRRRMAAAEKALEEQKAKEAAEKEKAAEKKRKSAERKKTAGKRKAKKEKLQKESDALIQELGKLGRRAHAGVPVDMLPLMVKLAYKQLQIGGIKFAEFAAKMKAVLDEKYHHLIKQAWDEAKKKRQEEGRKKAKETRLKNEKAKLEKKLAAGDFAPPAKREPIPLSPEGVKLQAEVEKLRREHRRGVLRTRRENRTGSEKVLAGIAEVVNLPRAVKASWDLSAPLRQGAVLTLAHPIRSVGHARQMFRATFSQDKALEIDVELRSHPLADLAERAKLELTRHGDDIGKHEEAIRSELSDRIPGIKASNRAFITYLNVQRMDAFAKMVQAIPGEVTLEQATQIARFVNIATGRGYAPGKLGGAMGGLSYVLWAPRLLLSRIQLLAGGGLVTADKHVKKQIAAQYARSIVGIATVYTLLEQLKRALDLDDDELNVEWDPRSSDFGKIKAGRTRMDPLAGLSQVLVLAGRTGSGETKSSITGEVHPIRGEVDYGRSDFWDVLSRFTRTKLAPHVSIPLDLYMGKNMVGEERGPKDVAREVLLPLAWSDIYETMEEQGIAKGTAMSIMSLFGWGTSTYGADEEDDK